MSVVRVESSNAPSRTGVLVGIAAISMSFAAFTSALVVRQGNAPDWQHFRLPPILFLNTLVLLASSLTLELSRARLAAPAGTSAERVRARAGLVGLYVTLGLGLLFVGGQFLAWRNLAAQGLYLATGPSSAFFYVLTVLHCVHVLGGLTALVYVLYRVSRAAGDTPLSALSAASIYWHFMGALWLYLLLILYLRV